jgi:hypothetical protein
MSAPAKTFPADPVRDSAMYTIPGSLRCTLVPVEEESEEKCASLIEWLLTISRDQKREAA